MLHACDQRFVVTGNLENFCDLNKALIASGHLCIWAFIRVKRPQAQFASTSPGRQGRLVVRPKPYLTRDSFAPLASPPPLLPPVVASLRVLRYPGSKAPPPLYPSNKGEEQMKAGRKNLRRACDEGAAVTLAEGESIMQVLTLRGSNVIEVRRLLRCFPGLPGSVAHRLD